MTIINKDLVPDTVSEKMMHIEIIPRHMHHYVNDKKQQSFITAIITYRICVIEEGSYIIRTNNEEVVLHKNDIILIPPFTSYEIICNEDESSAYIVDFKVHALEEEIGEFFSLDVVSIFKDSTTSMFMKHINAVYNKFINKELGYYLQIRITIEMLFMMMAIAYMKDNKVEYTTSTKYSSRAHECVMESLRYIDDNLSGDLSVSKLCEYLNVSQSYLYTCFKKVMNTSVQLAIIDSRLNKSLIYLRNDTLRVCDVAELVGFDNVFYFSNAFKKKYNMSPSDYRKQFIK